MVAYTLDLLGLAEFFWPPEDSGTGNLRPSETGATPDHSQRMTKTVIFQEKLSWRAAGSEQVPLKDKSKDGSP